MGSLLDPFANADLAAQQKATKEQSGQDKPALYPKGVDGPNAKSGDAENPGDKEDETPSAQSADDRLYFSFANSKWPDVIAWLASTADLALHVDELPKGTFSYNDSRGFTLEEAIDRINLFLLPEGFTLIRNGRLLSAINLNDPKSVKQLETLSRFVVPEELKSLEDYDLVKCLFPLGELKAEEAVEELSALNLIKTPDVFGKTNQILITDTAAKLKLAHKILSAFQPDTLDNGTIVKSFALKHVNAEDVLTVARPHLGLATGEMIGIDVSISADLLGKNIFVTGIEDKVKLIESLILEIDIVEEKKEDGEFVLQSHRVSGGNVELVYNVLQTLLSGKELRLSMDQKAQSIVAFAPEEIQREIAQTVQQLQASEAQFTVILLKHADPYLVITLLEQMLDLGESTLSTPTNSSSRYREDDGDRRWRDWRGWGDNRPTAEAVSPPKIDADPGGRKLFVLGTPSQIDQVKKIVAELDVPEKSVVDSGKNLRVLPLQGPKAVEAIETAARFWRGKNSIIFYSPAALSSPPLKERIVSEEEQKQEYNSPQSKQPIPGAGRILSKQLSVDEAPIQVQLTDRGILLQSDDTEALDQFEEILQTVIGPSNAAAATPIIYYLKYAKPDDAIRMLAELLDGGDSAREADSGSLVNGFVPGSYDSFFGSLVLSREGTVTLTYGSTTVVADTRLNRLIAQGTVEELQRVEGYLKIIDKDQSITSIEIYGTSKVIEIKNVDANQVAETLRQAFFGRVLGESGKTTQQTAQRSNSAQGNVQNGRDPRQIQEGNRDGRDKNDGRDNSQRAKQDRSARGISPTASEPKMTIAVHEPSNSLIVTAPDPLFKEVEKLVKLIDTRSVQTVEILKISRPLSTDIKDLLNGQIPSSPINRSDASRNSGLSTRRSSERDNNSRLSRPRSQ